MRRYFYRDPLNVGVTSAEESNAILEGFEARENALTVETQHHAWSHDADE
jgi:hypothetical protein